MTIQLQCKKSLASCFIIITLGKYSTIEPSHWVCKRLKPELAMCRFSMSSSYLKSTHNSVFPHRSYPHSHYFHHKLDSFPNNVKFQCIATDWTNMWQRLTMENDQSKISIYLTLKTSNLWHLRKNFHKNLVLRWLTQEAKPQFPLQWQSSIAAAFKEKAHVFDRFSVSAGTVLWQRV